MLRNLVSDIDVDQLVEDAGALNALTALMDEQVIAQQMQQMKL
jgi:hypothetical protein